MLNGIEAVLLFDWASLLVANAILTFGDLFKLFEE